MKHVLAFLASWIFVIAFALATVTGASVAQLRSQIPTAPEACDYVLCNQSDGNIDCAEQPVNCQICDYDPSDPNTTICQNIVD